MKLILRLLLVFTGAAHALAGPPPDIVVAQDGSGDFTSLQAAIDSVPRDNRERTVILIRNGSYVEHIRLEASFLTLRGEDRKKTRLSWEINDPRFRPDQQNAAKGIASFNIQDASDLIIENLTIENPGKLGGKPFAVISRGRSTRIVIQDADIIGYGGDTLSLWSNGFYYHRNLHVSGTYHFVGPRGTAYMADSTIEVLAKDKDVLFHDGGRDEQDKFVLHRCTFVSKVPFRLGSWFREAAWYFVECRFPPTLSADGAPHLSASAGYTFKWPTDRIYYAGIRGPDHPWLQDNIARSPAGSAATISAAWTFRGRWDPESTAAPALLSVAAGDADITVTFAEPVTVKGRPALKLADGTVAGYRGGSGSDQLVFARPAGSPAQGATFDLSEGTIQASQAGATARFFQNIP